MRARSLLLAAALAIAPQLAVAATALPPITAETLANQLPDGAKIEARLDADIDGDGRKDVVAVGASEDKRQIVVLLGYVGETDFGYRPVGVRELDPSPLGSADLHFARGVLVVTDLTGGTTATQSVYRYRYDKVADRMRLIGDDVTLYSRTYAHGSVAVSTNRLTGQRIVTRSEPAPSGEAAMIPGKPVVSKVPRTILYMEDAPDPDVTIERADSGTPQP